MAVVEIEVYIETVVVEAERKIVTIGEGKDVDDVFEIETKKREIGEGRDSDDAGGGGQAVVDRLQWIHRKIAIVLAAAMSARCDCDCLD